VKAMEFIDAHDVSEALDALDERGSEATVLAGGTDVVVQIHAGDLRPGALVHIRKLSELEGITANARTEIGALTTHWTLASSPLIRADHLALAEAALTVGGRQTQNIGTIAGNLVNASPAADLLPVLLVANAHVAVVGSGGDRSLPLEEFLVDRKRTALEPNELVASVSLERPGPRTGETYLKVGRRSAMEVALVGLAVQVRLDESDLVADARVAVGSVGPKAFRVLEAEAVLVGTRGEEAVVAEAGRLLQEAARPIDDVRGTAGYRRRVLPGLLARAVATSVDRARS
jgi:aerobic carbon-monoxide dehydrogenase medium subunit